MWQVKERIVKPQPSNTPDLDPEDIASCTNGKKCINKWLDNYTYQSVETADPSDNNEELMDSETEMPQEN